MLSTVPPPVSPDACLNCGEHLLPRAGGERAGYCPACGQETTIKPPTLREFAQQFGGAYVSTEGALWRTLKLLLTKPGELTALYLAGRRRHYVLPLRLYLSVSLLLFLTLRLGGGVEVIGGLDDAALRDAETGALPTVTVGVFGLRIGVHDGVFVCQGLPAALCSQVRSRAATDARSFLLRLRLANARVLQNLGAVMFVLLPLFAGCLKLVLWRSGLRYTEHLVFALHLHAFWFIVLGVMHLVGPVLLWPGVATMTFYTLMAGRRVYGGPWWVRVLRSTLLSVLYVSLLAVTLSTTWLLALLT
jgi:predicted RNA-binding Zn-ribbon protein involved in translation (DUF1610 family)